MCMKNATASYSVLPAGAFLWPILSTISIEMPPLATRMPVQPVGLREWPSVKMESNVLMTFLVVVTVVQVKESKLLMVKKIKDCPTADATLKIAILLINTGFARQ